MCKIICGGMWEKNIFKYQFEFLTDAYIGGSNTREEANFRPLSFIGILRYWFRVFSATLTNNVEEIFEKESELFGNQVKASRIRLKIKSFNREIVKHHKVYPSNIAYLGYGNISYDKSAKKFTPSRPFIPAGSKYKIEFLVPESLKDKLESLLYLVSKFGALGGRNRRGFGNFILIPLYDSEYKNWEYFDVDEIRTAFKNFENLLNYTKKRKVVTLKVYEYGKGHNPVDLLNDFGEKYKHFRNRRNPDYQSFKKFLLGNLKKDECVVYQRVNFGLPINIMYRSLNGKKGSINLFSGRNSLRRASPLMLKVVKENKNTYSLLLILNLSKFRPSNAEILAVSGKKRRCVNPGISPLDFIENEFIKSYLGIKEPLLVF